MNQGPGQTPGSMLEIYMHALENNTSDDFLNSVNLGVGNYTEPEYWQQIDAFRKGLFADSGMTRKVVERAKLEAQKRLVDAKYDGREDDRILRQIDMPDPEEGQSKHDYFNEHIQDVWENLGYEAEDGVVGKEEHQAWLISVTTGLGMDWVPPHWRMLMARHEASRSKDARLIDNVFGRPPEPDTQPVEDFK